LQPLVETLLADKDIAFIQKGLPAKMKFEAFPFQDYGAVKGQYLYLSGSHQ